MIRKEVEWFIRIAGTVLLLYAFYILYSRPLTHSYHNTFLFNHLQIVLWVMLLLILALVITSFSARKAQWAMGLVSVLLLAPYPFVHSKLSTKAEQYFFQQRYQHLQELNHYLLEAEVDEVYLYDRLAEIDVRGYEIGKNYIAYWVDRIPEQRDGFVFLIQGDLPERLFQFPIHYTTITQPNWYSFSSQ